MFKKLIPDPPPGIEETLVRACELLQCAIATAYESSDQLKGQPRNLALSVMHLVEMAQVMVEHSLDRVEQARLKPPEPSASQPENCMS